MGIDQAHEQNDLVIKSVGGATLVLKVYLHYKMITCQNVSYQTQVKNFFIL